MNLTHFTNDDGELLLDRVKIDPAWALKVPAAIAMRRLVLPICLMDGKLLVACNDTADTHALAAVAAGTGHEIYAVAAQAEQLRAALRRVYGDISQAAPGVSATSETDDVVALTDNIMRAAFIRQASDIHIDPERAGVRVRMRVDGVLEDFIRLPSAVQTALCGRIKIMAGLDIAERRAPQDGAFTWAAKIGSERAGVDVRVATLPVRFGERVTLRLLEAGKEKLTLDKLGMNPAQLGIMQHVLEKPHGLLLLTGPTGSGKTTTLYASIRHVLGLAPLNILTVEDPVEYEIPGVAQVEVDYSDKVNFSKALRSLLRHDPDVIMIGEIRDTESLDTAVKASLTGHLVLSTLHTNNAVSAITRLSDMGLAHHLIAATLRLSVAQRLVRRLCHICREPHVITAAQAIALGEPATGELTLEGRTAYVPHGCPACAGRGYAGRVGIFEFMQPTPAIASQIAVGAPETDILHLLAQSDYRTLADDAAAKVLQGTISINDIINLPE